MERMIRKQLYIDPEQEVRLKKMAEHTGLKEAELIRQGVDMVLSRDIVWARRHAASRRAEALSRKIQSQGPSGGPGRTWTREELYED